MQLWRIPSSSIRNCRIGKILTTSKLRQNGASIGVFILLFDAIVLRRASDDSLPDASVIRELERRGQSRIDAIHEIAKLVAEVFWEHMKKATEAGESGKLCPDMRWWSQARNEELNQRIASLVGSEP